MAAYTNTNNRDKVFFKLSKEKRPEGGNGKPCPPSATCHTWSLTQRAIPRPGCSMPEIWDVEDPANAGKPPLCNLLVKESEPHFTTVFQNSVYKVLEVIEE